MTQETAIDWAEALRLLASGAIVQVGQSHGQRVTLVEATGRRLVTHQPQGDAILQAVMALPPEVRDRIAVSTE